VLIKKKSGLIGLVNFDYSFEQFMLHCQLSEIISFLHLSFDMTAVKDMSTKKH
jgi:hypothetical protein